MRCSRAPYRSLEPPWRLVCPALPTTDSISSYTNDLCVVGMGHRSMRLNERRRRVFEWEIGLVHVNHVAYDRYQ